MKLATVALAAAFALSSTVAFANQNHKKHSAKTYHGSYARMQPAMYPSGNYYYGGNNYGWNNNGWNNNAGWNYNNGWNSYGNPNDRGGLVGGGDVGIGR